MKQLQMEKKEKAILDRRYQKQIPQITRVTRHKKKEVNQNAEVYTVP